MLRLPCRDPTADVRRDIAVNGPELPLGQWQTVPSFQRVVRRIIRRCGVAPIKEPVCPDLANAGYEQVGFVLPHARYAYPADIEVNIFRSIAPTNTERAASVAGSS